MCLRSYVLCAVNCASPLPPTLRWYMVKGKQSDLNIFLSTYIFQIYSNFIVDLIHAPVIVNLYLNNSTFTNIRLNFEKMYTFNFNIIRSWNKSKYKLNYALSKRRCQNVGTVSTYIVYKVGTPMFYNNFIARIWFARQNNVLLKKHLL